MATSFPSGLDSLSNPAASGHFLGTAAVLHSDQHANANDAIEALEAKVGVDGSSVASSLDYLAKVALPKGVLGYAQATADQGSITTEADLTGLSVTVTVGTGRRIRVTGHGLISSSVAQDDVIVYIKEGAAYHQRATQQTMPVAARAWSYEGSVILTPTAGSHTYKLSAHRNQGTGTVIHYAAAGYPAFILVEDIGAA